MDGSLLLAWVLVVVVELLDACICAAWSFFLGGLDGV